MSYEDQLIRESTERAIDQPWCSACERNSEDCICLEEATPEAAGPSIEMTLDASNRFGVRIVQREIKAKTQKHET